MRSIMPTLLSTVFLRRCLGKSINPSPAFLVQSRYATPKKHAPLHINSSLRSSSRLASTSCPTSSSLVGIDYVRSCIVDTLNSKFDPVDIAKGAAIAKLDAKKKKKKKDSQDDEQPTMSTEERMAIINNAASNAKPFTVSDAMVTPATKPEFGDYQCNAALSLSKSAGMNPRECASLIITGLKSIDGFMGIMEEPEIAGPGFINLKYTDDYLCDVLKGMAADATVDGRLGVPKTV
eukprot:scaffold1133_cov72-Cyclotella_meneghiniana.AAC.3